MASFAASLKPSSEPSSLTAGWASILRRTFPTVDPDYVDEATAIMIDAVTQDDDDEGPIDWIALDAVSNRMVSVLSDGASAAVVALRRGLDLERAGDVEGAEAAYSQAMDSGHPDAAPKGATNLGILLTARNDATRARAVLERAVESGHSDAASKAAFVLGILLERQGDKRGAERAYRSAVDSDHPDSAPKAAVNLGVLLTSLGDKAGAKAAFQRAADSGHLDAAPTAVVALKKLQAKVPLGSTVHFKA